MIQTENKYLKLSFTQILLRKYCFVYRDTHTYLDKPESSFLKLSLYWTSLLKIIYLGAINLPSQLTL